MDFLRQSIDIIWNRIPVEDFICNYLYARQSETDILINQYSRLLVDHYRELTLEEAEGVEQQLRENWLKEYEKEDHTTSFFNTLVHFTHNILRIQDNQPLCRFKHLLRWWETTQLIGPDLPTTAYLAYHDVHNNQQRKSFGWPSVIGHDYALLNTIMRKGLSELHTHLNGASLNFDLQWLSLMNSPSGWNAKCKSLEWNKFTSVIEHHKYQQYSVSALIVMAAEMRRWLFEQHVLHHSGDLQIHKDDSVLNYGQIDAAIQTLRSEYGYRYTNGVSSRGEVVDYAIDKVLPPDIEQTEHFVNSLLQGERRILYHTLRYLYGGKHDELYYFTQRVFMVYTRIKCHIRQQLIQVNQRKGFKNFQQYQGDKDLFIKKGSIYDELLKDVAIKNTYCNYPTEYLEYRIAPKSTEYEIRKAFQQLAEYDEKSYVGNQAVSDKSKGCKRYVIVHFIKRDYKDCKWATNRNYQLRKVIRKQALALRTAYKRSKVVREMLCGIDAANAERVARPEVFAQAFRFLRHELNSFQPNDLVLNKSHDVHITYHVGEDFWDILDGLRAIDEAVLFLEMEEGDRIGHGLALGTNPEIYYSKRHYSVIMPRQVLLDNMVWLYKKVRIYNIELPPNAKEFIDEVVFKMTQYIYGETYTVEECYRAWQLRGDEPSIIAEEKNANTIAGWEKYAMSESSRHQGDLTDRVRRCAIKYHMCRGKGDEMITYPFLETLIPVIRDVQNSMMADLGKKHIAIETNPTSNVRIGDFYRYDQHPIFRFKGYLPISINTDDVGVFDTSQTNEYALLACAMEKMKNLDGSPVYSNNKEICEWLDRVREVSISQRFVKE